MTGLKVVSCSITEVTVSQRPCKCECSNRETEKEGKMEKNKEHGKYSKAHAWALTKCKWKRKSLHQHTTIKGSLQVTCKLFSQAHFFSSLPFPFFFLCTFHPSIITLLFFSPLLHAAALLPQGGNSASEIWSQAQLCVLTSPERKQFILQDFFSVCPLIHQVQLCDHANGPQTYMHEHTHHSN